jgi:hypothetical protein
MKIEPIEGLISIESVRPSIDSVINLPRSGLGPGFEAGVPATSAAEFC